MKKLTRLICFSAFAITLLTAFSSEKCKTADLAIINIDPPEYKREIRGTVITLKIKNKGKQESEPCKLKLYDLDISLQEAKELGLDKLYLELIGENNARARYYSEEHHDIDSSQNDYDNYWEGLVEIPALKPGSEYTVTFNIENYWIYDSNCELRAIIDPDQIIADCDRSNNQMDFFGWG